MHQGVEPLVNGKGESRGGNKRTLQEALENAEPNGENGYIGNGEIPPLPLTPRSEADGETVGHKTKTSRLGLLSAVLSGVGSIVKTVVEGPEQKRRLREIAQLSQEFGKNELAIAQHKLAAAEEEVSLTLVMVENAIKLLGMLKPKRQIYEVELRVLREKESELKRVQEALRKDKRTLEDASKQLTDVKAAPLHSSVLSRITKNLQSVTEKLRIVNARIEEIQNEIRQKENEYKTWKDQSGIDELEQLVEPKPKPGPDREDVAHLGEN